VIAALSAPLGAPTHDDDGAEVEEDGGRAPDALRRRQVRLLAAPRGLAQWRTGGERCLEDQQSREPCGHGLDGSTHEVCRQSPTRAAWPKAGEILEELRRTTTSRDTMLMPEPTIRAAREADGPRLREIALAAKVGWGYDHDRVASWARDLRLFGEDVPDSELYVAESEGDVVAWMRLVPAGPVCVLEDLWVEPAAQGAGIGSTLFRQAVARANDFGAEVLEWEAEPNAVGFYERLGGRHVRDSAPSEWGRTLPVMALTLAG
jgi:GNAT superfamily N-acetyltransferase